MLSPFKTHHHYRIIRHNILIFADPLGPNDHHNLITLRRLQSVCKFLTRNLNLKFILCFFLTGLLQYIYMVIYCVNFYSWIINEKEVIPINAAIQCPK